MSVPASIGLASADSMRLAVLPALAIFCLTTTGCAIHRKMPRPLTPEAVEEVQDVLDRRGAWLEYGYPGHLTLVAALQQGSYQRVSAGRPSLILYTEDPAHAVPLEHARSLQVNNHWLGAAEGLGIGTLSGVLLGALLTGSMSTPKCDPADEHCVGWDFRSTVFLLTALTGAAAGAAIGLAVGQRYVYTF